MAYDGHFNILFSRNRSELASLVSRLRDAGFAGEILRSAREVLQRARTPMEG